MKSTVAIKDVKPVTFENAHASVDGECVVFTVKDATGNTGHIAIKWLDLGLAAQMIARGAEKASAARTLLGKSSDFAPEPGLNAQLVKVFQVSEVPAKRLKILSLQSPTGFRCDFAIPLDARDQRDRSLLRAMSEELLSDGMDKQQPM